MEYHNTDHRTPKSQWSANLPFLITLLVVVALSLWIIFDKRGPAYDPDAASREVTPRGALMEIEQTTRDLVYDVSPSVVAITTLDVRKDIFRMNTMEIPSGMGSGIIWDRDGHVITNYHVIVLAVRLNQVIRVTLSDQSDWDAKVVGIAPKTDLAVLHIDAPRELLKPIPIGSSDDLEVGQMMFAIGNPFGLDHSLTVGVLSALDREIVSVVGTRISGVIQTDAAVNPGNSGGPLLDSAGRLIGINTAIKSTSGSSAGIGFAVPVDTINAIVPQILRSGSMGQAGLGLTLISDKLKKAVGFDDGAMVGEVLAGSTAETAGLRSARRIWKGRNIRVVADLIVGLDDIKIDTRNDLIGALGRYKIGDVVRLTISRNGEFYETSVKLQSMN